MVEGKAKRGDLLDAAAKAPLEAPVPPSEEFKPATVDENQKYEYPQEPNSK